MTINSWFIAVSSYLQTPPILFAVWTDHAGWILAAVLVWFLVRHRNEPPRDSSATRLSPACVMPPPDPFSAQHITRTFVAALPSLTRELNLEVAT